MPRLATVLIFLALAVRLALPVAASLHHCHDDHPSHHAAEQSCDHAHEREGAVIAAERFCLWCNHQGLVKLPGLIPDLPAWQALAMASRPGVDTMIEGARSATWWRAGGRGPPTT